MFVKKISKTTIEIKQTKKISFVIILSNQCKIKCLLRLCNCDPKEFMSKVIFQLELVW